VTSATEQQVYIIDDDDAVRDAMSMLLESRNIAHQLFNSADQFIAAIDGSESGCLVLDIRMPGRSGLDLQQELNQRNSVLPIIFITGHGELPMAVKAMRRGALDFVRKPIDEDNLLKRIEEAFALESGVRLQFERRNHIEALFAGLTDREHEILDAVCNGATNKAIGLNLRISERTVEVHRSNLMKKTGVSSLAQLIRMRIELDSQ